MTESGKPPRAWTRLRSASLSPSSTLFPASTSVWIPPENFKGFLRPHSRPFVKRLPDSVLRPPQKCRASNHQTWTVSVGEPYAWGRGGRGSSATVLILCLWVYSTCGHTHIHTHKHTYTHSHTYSLSHTYSHSYTNTYTHKHIHTHIHINTHLYTLSYTHTHTHTHI